MEVLCHFEQRVRPAPAASQPTTKCLPGNIRSFAMTQSNDIDERPFCRVKSYGAAIADIEFFTPKIECVARKNMNIDGGAQRGNATAPRYGDVDTCGNNVGQSMARESSNQAKGAVRSSMRNFQKILVSFRSTCPLIEPTPNLVDKPLIPVRIEPFGRNAGRPRLGIGKDPRKAGAIRIGNSRLHR